MELLSGALAPVGRVIDLQPKSGSTPGFMATNGAITASEKSIPVAAWVAVTLMTAMYLAFPVRAYSTDCLAYAAQIEAADFWHPHHLLFNVFGWLAYRAANLFAPIRAVHAVQAMNALAAGVGLLLFFALAMQFMINRSIALWLTCLLGLSHAWWRFAIFAETYTLPVCCTLLGLLAVERQRRAIAPGPRFIACLTAALWFALAAVTHQTGILVVLTMPFWFAWRGHRCVDGLLVSMLTVTLVSGAYVAVFVFALHGTSTADLLGWTLAYALHPEFRRAYGGMPGVSNLWKALQAWSGAVSAEHGSIVLRAAMVEGLLAVLTVLGWRSQRRPAGEWRRTIGPLLVWAAPFALFAAWWEPGNVEFLPAALPPMLLCVGVALDRPPVPGRTPWTASLLAFVACAWTWAANARELGPLHEARRYAVPERAVAPFIRNGDLVIGLVNLNYLLYFHGIRHEFRFGLAWAARHADGMLYEYAGWLRADVEHALDRGSRVFTFELPQSVPGAGATGAMRNVAVSELNQEDVVAFYQTWALVPVAGEAAPVREIKRRPPPYP